MHGGRAIQSNVAGNLPPGSILQSPQQHQQHQGLTIQQGQQQFYGQQSSVPTPQQAQRILVQSPQQHQQGMLTNAQGQMSLGGSGNFPQQPQRQQLLPQQQPQQQHITQMTRGPLGNNSPIRQMMAAPPPIQQARHMAPPPPQYRPGYVMSARPPLNSIPQAPPGVYGGNPPVAVRPQYVQQMNSNTTAAINNAQQQQHQPTQIAPPLPPPAFHVSNYKGHVGYNCPTGQENCLISCVMLLTGYGNYSETTKALWKKIIRSYGGEVVNTYDPLRVTHVIMDWRLGDPTLYSRVSYSYFVSFLIFLPFIWPRRIYLKVI